MASNKERADYGDGGHSFSERYAQAINWMPGQEKMEIAYEEQLTALKENRVINLFGLPGTVNPLVETLVGKLEKDENAHVFRFNLDEIAPPSYNHERDGERFKEVVFSAIAQHFKIPLHFEELTVGTFRIIRYVTKMRGESVHLIIEGTDHCQYYKRLWEGKIPKEHHRGFGNRGSANWIAYEGPPGIRDFIKPLYNAGAHLIFAGRIPIPGGAEYKTKIKNSEENIVHELASKPWSRQQSEEIVTPILEKEEDLAMTYELSGGNQDLLVRVAKFIARRRALSETFSKEEVSREVVGPFLEERIFFHTRSEAGDLVKLLSLYKDGLDIELLIPLMKEFMSGSNLVDPEHPNPYFLWQDLITKDKIASSLKTSVKEGKMDLTDPEHIRLMPPLARILHSYVRTLPPEEAFMTIENTAKLSTFLHYPRLFEEKLRALKDVKDKLRGPKDKLVEAKKALALATQEWQAVLKEEESVRIF